jgi:serine/threonine protein kinase
VREWADTGFPTGSHRRHRVRKMGAACSAYHPPVYDGPTATVSTTLTAETTTKGGPLRKVADYKVRNQIGKGAYGAVYLVSKEHNSYEQFAMKVIDLNALRKKGSIGMRKNAALEVIVNEINVLKRISHRNCIRLVESIDDPLAKKYFLIMELVRGGELLAKLPESKPYLDEDDARIAFREV